MKHLQVKSLGVSGGDKSEGCAFLQVDTPESLHKSCHVPLLPSSSLAKQWVQVGLQLPTAGCCVPLSPNDATAALPARCARDGRRRCEHREPRSSRGSQAGACPSSEGRSAERLRAVPLSPAAAGRRTGTAGEEALPMSAEIYHLSLSCRSACSSLCPLRLRATCLRMHVTTSCRARCVRGERLLQQQRQSPSGPSAVMLLPLPSSSPTHTETHLRQEEF